MAVQSSNTHWQKIETTTFNIRRQLKWRHLDAIAIAKLVESPKATEHATMADRPMSITGFLPILSEAWPHTYAVKKRPNVNELAM